MSVAEAETRFERAKLLPCRLCGAKHAAPNRWEALLAVVKDHPDGEAILDAAADYIRNGSAPVVRETK